MVCTVIGTVVEVQDTRLGCGDDSGALGVVSGAVDGGECSTYNLGAFSSFDGDEGAYSGHFDEIAG